VSVRPRSKGAVNGRARIAALLAVNPHPRLQDISSLARRALPIWEQRDFPESLTCLRYMVSNAVPASTDERRTAVSTMRGVRAGARVVLALAVIASPALLAAAAGAGVTDFLLSPTSGPAGTEVSVSGSGCVPGL